MDNAAFDVFSGASLTLTGSSDTVVIENGSGQVSVSGNGNTIDGTHASGNYVSISGTGNVATLGDKGNASDYGNGDTISVGAGGTVNANGSNTTVNATAGGAHLTFVGSGGIANANNDTISLNGTSTQVNGDGNTIRMWVANDTLSLNGSNNAISFIANTPTETILTATSSLTEKADGSFVLTGSANQNAVAFAGGTVTVQLGNGNVATVSGVTSGSAFQYVDSSGHVTTSSLTDADLVHMAANLYAVTGDVVAKMDNAIFDVAGGVNFHLTGSSDMVILESSSSVSSSLYITGNGNTIGAANSTGASVTISGTGNTATLGAKSHGSDYGNGDTLALGAGGSFVLSGTNATLDATAGGSTVTFSGGGQGNVANVNNDAVHVYGWAVPAQVNGDGNQISVVGSSSTLSLDGSNNTVWVANDSNQIKLSGGNNTVSIDGVNNAISFNANGPDSGTVLIQSAAGDYVEESASGAISFSTARFSISHGVVTLGFADGNVVTISGVLSSTDGSNLQADNHVNQLVSAMASYSAGSGGVSSTLMAQTSADASLFASSHH